MQKLEEVSRNTLLGLTKSEPDLRVKYRREQDPNGPHSNREQRSAGYKGFNVKNVDMSNVLHNNSLLIQLGVGDYDDIVELEDILYWLQISAENTNSQTKNQINTKVVTQALMNSIDGMDIKLDCSCADWQYRFAYQATILGYKYGEKEGRPNEDIRANPENRGGVCFDGDTLVCCENGYKKIKDIQVGDKVYTHTGQLKVVLDNSERLVTQIQQVHIGTQNILCTPNHPFYIIPNYYAKKLDFKFEPINEIGKYYKPFACKPFLKLDTSVNIDYINAFMLGLYLADGNISERPYRDNQLTNLEIALDKRLYNIYSKFLQQYNIEFGFKTSKQNSNSGCIVIHNNSLRNFCNKYGSHNYKNISTKFIDKSVLNWTKSAKIALLQGFFVGDGQYCSSGKNINVRLLNTNKKIIETLHIILKSLNINSKLCKYKRKPRKIANNKNVSIAKDMYCITITGNDCEIFISDFLKQFKGKKSSSYNMSKYVHKIQTYNNTQYSFSHIKLNELLNKDMKVYNLSVADDESYLVTYDNIAVHNCKHLYSVLSNKRWLQQVTSTFMNWLEQNIDGVNKYLGLKGDKVLTLPNELARANAKLSWEIRRKKNAEQEPEEEPQENVEDNSKNSNVAGNNPSTNKYNNIDEPQENQEEQ